MSYRPFWIIDGDESYDPNSGTSFSVLIYVVDASGSVFKVLTSLCKPQIYGLWHCLWNNELHLSKIRSLNAKGVVVMHKETHEFMMLPIKDYYPFPNVFPLKPHCLSSEEYNEIIRHIDNSVESFSTAPFFNAILNSTVPSADYLFDLLDEKTQIDITQKATIIEAWSKKIIDDLVEFQEEEYGLK